MKKIVNDPKQYVPEMLKGLALANPDTLRYVPEYNLIMRADAPRDDKVSIIQGSGSGHEPAHVMAVGRGMLDGACPGDVFAAPPMDYVYETTKLLKSVGFAVTTRGSALGVTPPSWRHDIGRDVDLVEEVARLRGYDRLPDALTGARPGTVPDHPMFTMARRVRDALVAAGLL